MPLELILGSKNQGVHKALGYGLENILPEVGLSRKKIINILLPLPTSDSKALIDIIAAQEPMAFIDFLPISCRTSFG